MEFAATACEGLGAPDAMIPWLAAGVGQPGWRHYMAFAANQPVAAGAMFVHAGRAWLGLGSTLPPWRGHGAQGALMARRITDATEMGCEWIATETREQTEQHPSPSFRNMMRCGFQLAYARPNFIRG